MLRAVATVAVLLGGLIGLFMSLCGGGFLLMATASAIQTKSSSPLGVAMIAVPSILGGIAIIVGCARVLMKSESKD